MHYILNGRFYCPSEVSILLKGYKPELNKLDYVHPNNLLAQNNAD